MKHRCHHGRFRPVIFDHFVFFFHSLRLLKAQLSRQGLHLLIKVLADLGNVSLEDFLNLSYVLLILLQRLQPFAGAFAAFDVILQADLILPTGDGFGGQLIFAGANGIKFLQHLQHHAGHEYRGIGAIILRSVAHDVARLIDAWEILVFYNDRWIGLIVFQQDIVARAILLNKVVLEQQGVFLRIDHEILDIANLLHQHTGLHVVVFLIEIGRDTPLQVLRLADIDNCALLVEVLIATRLLGDDGQDHLDMLAEHRHTNNRLERFRTS